MTEKPTVTRVEPESPPHSPESSPPPAATPQRSRRKKILVPVVLAAVGLALLLVGFLTYPRRAEPPAPSLGFLDIQGISVSQPDYVSRHIQDINIYVDQVHPDVARLTIQITLTVPVRHGQQALIGISHLGGAVMHCSPSCNKEVAGHAYAEPYVRSDRTATAHFWVKAHSLGVAANGVTAAAAFPTLITQGTLPAIMGVFYNIPSASSYDWSSDPPVSLSNSHIEWDESVIPNQPPDNEGRPTFAQVATGINHAAESHDNTLTLFAGVLFGLGGGALVAAVQEALHD
jgi:hypothetical protein